MERNVGSGRAVSAGLSIALVAYVSSFAVVLAGLSAVGASHAQATSGLTVLCLAFGAGTLWLSLRHREPVTLAWSTPGAAVLAATGAVHGGWPTAVGAFMVTGGLIVLTGVWRRLGALVTAIPAPVAQAMLAGVVLQICLQPVRALVVHPWEVTPILLVWLLLTRVAHRWAVPGAFAAMLAVVGVLALRHAGPHGPLLPAPTWTTPRFTWSAAIGIALPLYVVTMAGQNVPGVAIMSSFGYRIRWREAMTVTGLLTLAGAPAGGHAVNLAAISASVPASELAHPDPERRWPAATAFGATAIVLAVLTTALTTFLSVAPAGVVGTIAGVGLLGVLGNSLHAAFEPPAERAGAAVTLAVAVSGVDVAGVGAPACALVAGLIVRAAVIRRRTSDAGEASASG